MDPLYNISILKYSGKNCESAKRSTKKTIHSPTHANKKYFTAAFVFFVDK